MSDITIAITRETPSVTQTGFGMPLIVDDGAVLPYAECATLADVVAAGYGIATDTYAMATAVWAQNPNVPTIAVVGLDPTLVPAEADLTSAAAAVVNVSATAAGVYDGRIGNGINVEIVDVGGVLAASYNLNTRIITVDLGGATRTAADIAAAIHALGGFDSAATAVGDFTVADDVGIVEVLAGGQGGLTNEIVNLAVTENDWYFILCTAQTTALAEDCADAADILEKLYIGSPDDTVANVVISAAAMNTDRAALIYHDDPGNEFPDAAWVGKCAPFVPGSLTWKFKTLTGVDEAVVNSTELAALDAGNVATYISKFGTLQTTEGRTTAGGDYGFIDITRGTDYIKYELAASLMDLLATTPKVPFTAQGIAQVKNRVVSVLDNAVKTGLIATDAGGNGIFEVTTPSINDIPVADKAARNLPDVEFNFQLAGAIHTVVVDGVIRL